MYYGPMNYGYHMGWGIFMAGLWLIIWVIIALLVIRMIRRHDSTGCHKNANDPLDIVKERYAKGEINKEHFEQLKKDLK